MKKIKSNRSKAVETAAGLTSLPLSSNDISTVGVALEMHSARNPVSGAFAAPVPTVSGDGPIKSSGTKCCKEKMTVSKKAKVDRTHRQGLTTKSPKSVGGVGLNTLSAAAAKHSKAPSGHKCGSNGESFADFEVSIAKSILGKFDLKFYCNSTVDGDVPDREFICEDEIQRLQAKLAAYRCSWTKSDSLISTSKSSKPETMFGALLSPVDGKTIGVRVIFVLNESLPVEIDTTAILRKLGVPSGFELVQYSNSEVYALIAEVFAIDGLDRSEYESVFGSSDMPWICSDMCASVYKDFGDITFPPMTLSEFGNVLHCLKFFDEEVALATLRRIYSDRCQA
jgi:hypothetical protein